MYYLLKIDQVCRTNPSAGAYSKWEMEKSKHSTPDELKERLAEIYGKIPFRKDSHKVYQETENGDFHAGYTYSYWEDAYDRSNPGKKYWAEDWITIIKVERKPVENLSDWEQ